MLTMVAAVIITVMLVVVVLLSWAADVRRVGGATSAREANPRATESRARRVEARLRAEAAEAARRRPAPPPPVAAPLSDEARHRATLELPPGPVTADALRRQYRTLVVAYHPDRVAGLGTKLQRLAEDETKALNEAYAWFKMRTTDGG